MLGAPDGSLNDAREICTNVSNAGTPSPNQITMLGRAPSPPMSISLSGWHPG
jgi:hypothetical protein